MRPSSWVERERRTGPGRWRRRRSRLFSSRSPPSRNKVRERSASEPRTGKPGTDPRKYVRLGVKYAGCRLASHLWCLGRLSTAGYRYGSLQPLDASALLPGCWEPRPRCWRVASVSSFAGSAAGLHLKAIDGRSGPSTERILQPLFSSRFGWHPLLLPRLLAVGTYARHLCRPTSKGSRPPRAEWKPRAHARRATLGTP